jgi:hypothetical protein
VRRSAHRDAVEEPEDPTPDDGLPDHLSQINTVWSMVLKAHADDGAQEPTRAARAWLWNQYQRAIRKYLERSIPDKNGADEMFQEFGIRILQGDLRGARQDRGKFRFYLKQALRHQVLDYFRKCKLDAARLTQIQHEKRDDARARQVSDADQQFVENWRADLLQATWQRMHDHEQNTGQPRFTVLQIRAAYATESSERLAEIASAQLARPVSAHWFNRQVHEARKLIAAFLLEEVGRTLWTPTADGIEEELIALGLLDFPSVKDALRELREKSDTASPNRPES